MDGDGFMPHGAFFLRASGALSFHVIADAVIGVSCGGISLLLAYVIRRRPDLPFPSLFWLFATLIFLGGMSQTMNVWVVWHPDCHAQGWITAATAAAAVTTFAAFMLHLRRVLKLVSTRQLTAQNVRLSEQLAKTEEQDVTMQKAAMEEREKLLACLTLAKAEVERFAYVASHDLQEPVRMMLSFSSLLEEDYAGVLDQEGQAYLKIISSSALRMHTKIRDLMNYARLDGEQREFVSVDLHQELAAVEDNLRQLITETGALITSDTLPHVHGCAVQVVRLLQNLIINAIRYQPRGQVPLIHLGVTEENGKTVFHLRDNGLGIKQSFVEEIFQPFRRLHTWDSIPGSGLGLSVCRKIIEGHGGRIWASSKPGDGTTISFTLS